MSRVFWYAILYPVVLFACIVASLHGGNHWFLIGIATVATVGFCNMSEVLRTTQG